MKPFRDMELRSVLANQTNRVKGRVEGLSNEEIMANSLDILADNLYEEFYIPPVIIHDEDVTKRSIIQTTFLRRADYIYSRMYGRDYVDVDGLEFTFWFPVEGESDLFKCSASTVCFSAYPEITLCKGYMKLSYQKTYQEMEREGAKEQVLKECEHDLDEMRSGISLANKDVHAFNNALKDFALKCLQEKHKKVSSFFDIRTMFEIQLTKTEYAATHIPVKRNIRRIQHTYNKETTFSISDEVYVDILDAITHTASTYERTPSSFKSMQEEDLRNTLLATLNATFKGDAVGEAFRNKGKTDICIEQSNRAAFVAECKMWTGQKEVENALSQLDGYLTWRDCKTALIYFVRRKDFLRVTTTAEETLRNISFMRSCRALDKNIFECVMVSTSNPGQLIRVRVMLFNLYSE